MEKTLKEAKYIIIAACFVAILIYILLIDLFDEYTKYMDMYRDTKEIYYLFDAAYYHKSFVMLYVVGLLLMLPLDFYIAVKLNRIKRALIINTILFVITVPAYVILYKNGIYLDSYFILFSFLSYIVLFQITAYFRFKNKLKVLEPSNDVEESSFDKK